LQGAIAADPGFFMYLLGCFYFPEGSSDAAETVPSEGERNVAKQAFRVLSNWTIVPGSDDSGEIDVQFLRSWIGEVRKLAKERRLVAVAESKIGAILSRATRKAGVPWPPEAVRQIIESSKSEELENGFYVALRNSRGVTIRRPTDGGSLERELAASYRSDARSVGAAQVRTRALLNIIAESYEREADGEDRSAEQRDW